MKKGHLIGGIFVAACLLVISCGFLEVREGKMDALSDFNYTVPEHPYETRVTIDGNLWTFKGRVMDVKYKYLNPDVIIFEDGAIVPVESAEYKPWKKEGVQKVIIDYSYPNSPVVKKVEF